MPGKENRTGVLTNRQRPTSWTALKAIGWALTMRADPSPQASQPERPITGQDAVDASRPPPGRHRQQRSVRFRSGEASQGRALLDYCAAHEVLPLIMARCG